MAKNPSPKTHLSRKRSPIRPAGSSARTVFDGVDCDDMSPAQCTKMMALMLAKYPPAKLSLFLAAAMQQLATGKGPYKVKSHAARRRLLKQFD